MTTYLLDQDNNNYHISTSFEAKIGLTLRGLPSQDITLDQMDFDLGVENEVAVISGAVNVLEPSNPQKIEITIPANTFTKPVKRQMLQIRWTPLGENERIIVKKFLDVRSAVVPNP